MIDIQLISICNCICALHRNAIDRLVRSKDGKLKLNKQDKPVVLVLGTGWGAHSLIKVGGSKLHVVGFQGRRLEDGRPAAAAVGGRRIGRGRQRVVRETGFEVAIEARGGVQLNGQGEPLALGKSWGAHSLIKVGRPVPWAQGVSRGLRLGREVARHRGGARPRPCDEAATGGHGNRQGRRAGA